jgi:DNA topoisomerase-1
LKEGEHVTDRAIEAEQHFTQPPPRYSEATLIKRMEELGIGRPSTYTSTMAVLVEREYVRVDKKRLVPEDKGRLVIAFLESFFRKYVEFDFTADLEEKLDLISDGKLAWKDVLRDFWTHFTGAVDEIKDLRVGDVLEALNELLGPHIFPAKDDGSDARACPSCGTGRLSLKISGKYGAFIGCNNYPECRYTRQLSQSESDIPEAAGPDGKLLGYDDESTLAVTLRSGRFGPYLQLGDPKDYADEKPKRSSIPKGIDAATIDLEKALQLLRLPREVGTHPETGTPVVAGLGRYGPFVLHDGTYANLESIEDVFTIGINRAVTVLAEKRSGKGGGRFGRAAQRQVLKELGEHPELGGKIEVLNGRYGPYIAHNKVYANVPKGTEPAAVTVEQAVQLLAERAAKGPSKKTARKAPGKSAAKAKATKGKDAEAAGEAPPKKKAPAKKAPAKKTARGKSAAE